MLLKNLMQKRKLDGTTKYSIEQKNEWSGRIAIVLAEAQDALTIDEIQHRDVSLVGMTPQMTAKILNHLVEMGLVAKSKNRSGRMVYKSLAVMEEQGYDTEPYKGGANMLDKREDYIGKYEFAMAGDYR